jgi:hypothetical protein
MENRLEDRLAEYLQDCSVDSFMPSIQISLIAAIKYIPSLPPTTLTLVPVMLVPTAAPAMGRMVMRLPSVISCRCATRRSTRSGSSSTARLGVRLRGFDRGRFNLNGEGLPLRRSASGEATLTTALAPVVTKGDECRMRRSMELSVAVFAILEGGTTRSSGMLSERWRRVIDCRWLERELIMIIVCCC